MKATMHPSPPNTASGSEQPDTQDVKPVVEGRQSNQNASQNLQKAQKSRHRASVACASCRDRRIRCVVPPGQKECTQCKRSGVECIIKNDDERRRPISRAYVCSLTDRVALLESMLKERGTEPPPANHPPKTRHGNPREQDPFPNRKAAETQSQHQDNSSPANLPSPPNDFIDVEQHDQDSGSHHGEMDSTNSPSMLPPPKKNGMVSRLLSTRGHLSFDQLSGRLRYFGPTTNCHVHSEAGDAIDFNWGTAEQAQRAKKIIRSLPLETYEYLMGLFWQFYNPVIHVLHQEAFNDDREAGRTQFYSGFLHVCVLAMGFRFADKTRPDIHRISLPQMESTLHREAKYMLDHELERPSGIPSVVSLLLLGDLECGVGRDNLGWLYGGLAVKLAFDIGLHLDARTSGLPEREVEIRQMTLWACVIYDKYWALFLGRPTSMKSSDLEIYSLSKPLERLGTCRPTGLGKCAETLIYEALLDLMELAGKITQNIGPRAQLPDSVIDRNQYLRMAALDREFSHWYSRLPEQLRWTPANIATGPFSFFLLHQQYHSSLILLHRPFAMYEDHGHQEYEGSRPDSHFSALSRTVCTKHAIRVARIFWQHRQRFNSKQIFVTGLQHAGTAATALVAALAFNKNPIDRNNNMQYLECLFAALQEMAYTYQPAERMFAVLHAVMIELRGGPPDINNLKLYESESALVPARRGSTNESADPRIYKRRQTSRSRAGIGSTKTQCASISASITRAYNTDLTIKLPDKPRFDKESGCNEGYVLVTRNSELCSWPGLEASLETALPTPSVRSASGPNSAWMGTELGSNDNMVHLANAHFPEIQAFGHELEGIDEAMSDTAGNGGLGSRTLDCMIDGGNVDWVREWNAANVGVGSDLDGFPPQNRFGLGSGFTGKEYGDVLSG